MKIPCKKCYSEMLFPYLRCGECGWVPKGALRDRAIKLARKHIKKNRDREEELTIILEEVLQEDLKEVPRRRRTRPETSDRSSQNKDEKIPAKKKMDFILKGVIALIVSAIGLFVTWGDPLGFSFTIACILFLWVIYIAYVYFSIKQIKKK